MSAEDGPKTDHRGSNRLTRREALARLGIGAGVAYGAPVLLPLNQAGVLANGHEPPGPHTGDEPPWGRPSVPGAPQSITTKPVEKKAKKN